MEIAVWQDDLLDLTCIPGVQCVTRAHLWNPTRFCYAMAAICQCISSVTACTLSQVLSCCNSRRNDRSTYGRGRLVLCYMRKGYEAAGCDLRVVSIQGWSLQAHTGVSLCSDDQLLTHEPKASKPVQPSKAHLKGWAHVQCALWLPEVTIAPAVPFAGCSTVMSPDSPSDLLRGQQCHGAHRRL